VRPCRHEPQCHLPHGLPARWRVLSSRPAPAQLLGPSPGPARCSPSRPPPRAFKRGSGQHWPFAPFYVQWRSPWCRAGTVPPPDKPATTSGARLLRAFPRPIWSLTGAPLTPHRCRRSGGLASGGCLRAGSCALPVLRLAARAGSSRPFCTRFLRGVLAAAGRWTASAQQHIVSGAIGCAQLSKPCGSSRSRFFTRDGEFVDLRRFDGWNRFGACAGRGRITDTRWRSDCPRLVSSCAARAGQARSGRAPAQRPPEREPALSRGLDSPDNLHQPLPVAALAASRLPQPPQFSADLLARAGRSPAAWWNLMRVEAPTGGWEMHRSPRNAGGGRSRPCAVSGSEESHRLPFLRHPGYTAWRLSRTLPMPALVAARGP